MKANPQPHLYDNKQHLPFALFHVEIKNVAHLLLSPHSNPGQLTATEMGLATEYSFTNFWVNISSTYILYVTIIAYLFLSLACVIYFFNYLFFSSPPSEELTGKLIKNTGDG